MPLETHAGEYYPNITPRKNYVFAVNYELVSSRLHCRFEMRLVPLTFSFSKLQSMVDQFTLSQKKRRRSLDGITEDPAGSTRMEDASRPDASNVSISDNSEPDNKPITKNRSEDEEEEMYRAASPSKLIRQEIQSPTRKSTRDKSKREVPLARARVRYDMQLVPPVNRNRSFLQYFFESNAPRRSSRLQAGEMSDSNEPPPPFTDGNTTVVWVPSKRSEWEDSVSEMTAVCTSAAIRRYMIDMKSSSSCTKPFHAPLSREYIRDRVDIDDPLRGFQLRHRDGGWLQGFVLWTNFTTWTHYFKWDSLHPESGFSASTSGKADVTGELANELEMQPRSGDPRGEGVVFEGIAELALLGGLGCGEILLRMALESITKTGKYKYLVLQATDSSKTFYERFGFVRVGAVCRYEKQLGAHETEPIQGYCHWTHANESEKSLQKHGGPSYMMCLKLSEHGAKTSGPSFLDEMMKLAVENKPTVEPLGAAISSSAMKSSVRRSSSSDFSSVTPRRGRPPLSARGKSPTPRRKSIGMPPSQVIVRTKSSDQKSHKHNLPLAAGDQPPLKRRRVSDPDSPIGSMKLVPSMSSYKGSLNSKGGGSVGLNPMTSARDATVDGSQARRIRPDMPSPEPLTLSPSSPKAIDKNELCKQKVKAYPRSRVHYYNRVVKSKLQTRDKKYYFVLQYDEPSNLIKIVPLSAKNILTGKREGRPRYQADIGDTDENFVVVRADDYDVVPAAMVMKTPIVAAEAWDVEDD